MKYKDFIKPGNVVAFIPDYDNPLGWDYDVDPQVVTIGEYKPYYTDDTPDPSPEEYEECCQVEIVEDVHGECQIRLADLYGIKFYDEEEKYNAIWGTERVTVTGEVAYNYDDLFIIACDGKMEIVSADDFERERDLCDLSEDELKKLRKEICVGSIFTADYENSFGISPSYLCDVCDAYLCYLYDKYGEDESNHDTPEEFANYCA